MGPSLYLIPPPLSPYLVVIVTPPEMGSVSISFDEPNFRLEPPVREKVVFRMFRQPR